MGVLCISRQPQTNFGSLWTQKHQEPICVEEAYMLMRQTNLNLHEHTINDFVLLLGTGSSSIDSKFLSELDYATPLCQLKCLPQNLVRAKDSIYWQRFYAKFQMNEAQLLQNKLPVGKVLFDKTRVLVGLSLLTTDQVKTKVKVIFEVLAAPETNFSEAFITNDKVSHWLSTYLMVACNFLPILANDYPQGNKVRYYKLFKDWNDKVPTVVNDMTHQVMGTALRLQLRDFQKRCQDHLFLFDVSCIRSVVSTYVSIS